MSSDLPFRAVLCLAILLVATLSAPETSVVVSADCEEDLVELREDLNATQRELALVKEERDDYAQRLEDSTTILILVMFLLVGSYIVFFLNTRRAKIALLEYQKRMGIEPGTRPKRRRRG